MATTQVKDGFQGGSDNQLKVNTDGSINVNATSAPGGEDVNIHDSAGNSLNSTNGALDVTLQGLSQFKTNGYVVNATAVQIAAVPLATRSSVGLKAVCTTGDAVYIGSSSAVTALTGWPLFNDDALELDITAAQAIWAIGSSPGQYLYIIEIGD